MDAHQGAHLLPPPCKKGVWHRTLLPSRWQALGGLPLHGEIMMDVLGAFTSFGDANTCAGQPGFHLVQLVLYMGVFSITDYGNHILPADVEPLSFDGKCLMIPNHAYIRILGECLRR